MLKRYSLLPMKIYVSKYKTVKVLYKKQATKRRYKEDYIGCGFISWEPEEDPLPFCLICNLALGFHRNRRDTWNDTSSYKKSNRRDTLKTSELNKINKQETYKLPKAIRKWIDCKLKGCSVASKTQKIFYRGWISHYTSFSNSC